MTRRIGGTAGGLLLLGALLGASHDGQAAEYIPPPIMPVPNAWQGRSVAVVRVLDKLDAHIETLTLKAGETGTYKSLSVTVRSCMDRPDGMPADSGAFLDVQDRRSQVQAFSGWTFSGQPSIGVFESPVYGVQLVTCQGDLVAPLAPPLPQAAPEPESLLPGPVASTPSDSGGSSADTPATDTGGPAASDATPDNAPPAVDQPSAPSSGVDQPSSPGRDATPEASTPGPAPGHAHDDSDDSQPDPVYPTGAPPLPPAPAPAPASPPR